MYLINGRVQCNILAYFTVPFGKHIGDEQSIEQTVDSGPDVGHDSGFYGGTRRIEHAGEISHF